MPKASDIVPSCRQMLQQHGALHRPSCIFGDSCDRRPTDVYLQVVQLHSKYSTVARLTCLRQKGRRNKQFVKNTYGGNLLRESAAIALAPRQPW